MNKGKTRGAWGLKRLFAAVTAALLIAVAAGCGSGGLNQNGDGGGPSGPRKKVNISIFNGGNGHEWLLNAEKVYENANKNVDIVIKTTVLPWQLLDQIKGGLTGTDIFMGISPLHPLVEDGTFIPLDDVYAKTAPGETKTLEEKLSPEYRSDVRYGDHYTAILWADNATALAVNLTTLNGAFPGGGYELPRTSDELLALGDRLKSAGVYPMVFSGGDSYMNYLLSTFWAQYDLTAYDNYFTAQHIVEGETVKAANGESLNQPGKLAALQACEILLRNTNGYMHPNSNSMTFIEAQAAFAGLGYGFNDNKKVAFMPNGSWLENEIHDILIDQPQDIVMIKVPVISAIRERLASVESDAELSALIKAIDANATALSGTGYEVTQKDFDEVKMARSLVGGAASAHQAGIPANSQVQAEAKDFLVFLASDTMGQIFAAETRGLLMPYGYIPQESGAVKFSDFAKSIIDFSAGSQSIRAHLTAKPVINGLTYTRGINDWSVSLFNRTKTAESIYNEDINHFLSQWQYIVG
jgi:ABC-type glycerol-3-phosphate transport system substrate-binding protein